MAQINCTTNASVVHFHTSRIGTHGIATAQPRKLTVAYASEAEGRVFEAFKFRFPVDRRRKAVSGRLTRLMRMRFRDEGDGSHATGNTDEIMKQSIEDVVNSSSKSASTSSLLSETDVSKRLLKRVQKLMHDAIQVKNPDMPDKTLTRLREEYIQLDWDNRRKALKLLSTEFGVDKQRVKNLIQHYLSLDSESGQPSTTDNPDTGLIAVQYRNERDLRSALVPLSVRLFEQMNGQTGGLKFLVDLRADLLSSLRDDNLPALRALDSDMRGLFSTWLSPACLELHQITWNDAASLLEKIVRYEAVHRISNLYDLKRRLGVGRRCFGYFHPAMPGEPLVFIEVALIENIGGSIQEVLFDKPPISEDDATTALFYSISSTQPGLSGIDLGNFLIKRVLRLLQQEMPQIKTFVTLSPIPGFVKWLIPKLASLSREAGAEEVNAFKEDFLLPHEDLALIEAFGTGSAGVKIMLDLLTSPDHQWTQSEKLSTALQLPLMRLCARYLLQEKKRGKALDPVANFHLRNGASMERLNWMGDKSIKGLQESAGLMVNYLYRPEKIEENNHAYLNKGIIEASSSINEYFDSGLHSAL